MTKRYLLSVLAFVFFTFAAFSYIIFFDDPFGTADDDPLCTFAKTKSMRCVGLASPNLYERGAIVSFDDQKKFNGPLPFADEYLFSESCLLPGADIGFAEFHDNPKSSIALPNRTIVVDRSLSASTGFSSKMLGGLKIELGPNADRSLKVKMSSSGAQFFNIESAPLHDAVKSCFFRKSCTDRIKNPNNHIIKELLVAKDLNLTVEKNDGAAYPLSVAIEDGLIKVDLGVKRRNDIKDELPVRSDMVFGARFFDPKDFADIKTCDRDLALINATATSTSTVLIQPYAKDEPVREANVVDKDESVDITFEAKDRAYNEGMIEAEAKAAGKPIIDHTTGTVEFTYLLLAAPGQRWTSVGPDGQLLDPEYKRIFASAKSRSASKVELQFANRTDDPRHLVMHIEDHEKTSLSLISPFAAAVSSDISPFIITRKDKDPISFDAVWHRGNDDKDFDLGQLDPGESVKLLMGYDREIHASYSVDAGTVSGDVVVSFTLK